MRSKPHPFTRHIGDAGLPGLIGIFVAHIPNGNGSGSETIVGDVAQPISSRNSAGQTRWKAEWSMGDRRWPECREYTTCVDQHAFAQAVVELPDAVREC